MWLKVGALTPRPPRTHNLFMNTRHLTWDFTLSQDLSLDMNLCQMMWFDLDLLCSLLTVLPVCIFSSQWRCSQVGKTLGGQDTHTHKHLHTWNIHSAAFDLAFIYILHTIVLSAFFPLFRSTSVIHQRGALTFRFLCVRRPLPHSTNELVVHRQLPNGASPFKKRTSVWSGFQ